jgi:tetratricopeptide (TPR) repeat protein
MSEESSLQSGGVSYGDQASGNITITGGVKGDIVVHMPLAPTVSALHQLPPPPADFTGRDAEIGEMLAAFEDASLSISGLQGMGGVGKTALALKLADKIKERYPDGQFYIDLLGVSPQPLTLAKAMEHVIRAYHPGAKLPEGEAELRGIYLSVLHGKRALLLMDNARDKKQVESLIPPASCRLLVTSRQYFTLPGFFAKNLDCLPSGDACKLLLSIAPRIGDLAEEVARLCGYLPFALRLAASAIADRRNIKPASYMLQLANAQKRLELIEASLTLSYEILNEEQQQRWRMLAVFPDSFDDAAAAAVWETEDEKARDALGELLAFNLVEWNETAGRYRLHDLARVFAESRLHEAARDRGSRLHAQHYQEVLSTANSFYLKGGDDIRCGLALYDLERMNIEAGQAWASEQTNNDATAAELCLTYPDAILNVLLLRQHPKERIQWLEAMLAAARRLNHRNAEYRALDGLALAHYFTGELWRAIELYQLSLAVAREDNDQKTEVNALSNLALTYADLGEKQRAIELCEQVLTIARESGDRGGEGRALGNFGWAYDAWGEKKRAVEYYEQYLIIVREIGDAKAESDVLFDMGYAYANLGETNRAIRAYEEVLVLLCKAGDRIEESSVLNYLGRAFVDQGDIQRAIKYFERCCEISEEIGDIHGVSQAFEGLGLAYAGLGEHLRAIDFYEQALKILRKAGNRREERKVLWNMALALDALGNRMQAIRSAEEALVIFEQVRDPRAEKVRALLAEWKAGDVADRI